VSVKFIELLQVWQAGAQVKEATGAEEPETVILYRADSEAERESDSVRLLPERVTVRVCPERSSLAVAVAVEEIPRLAPSMVKVGEDVAEPVFWAEK